MTEILKNEKPAGTGEVQTDLTEYQRSMEALRESEDKYRTLVEKSLDAIAIVKEDRLVFVNKAFLEMFGYVSDREVIGSTITDYLALQSQALVRSRGFARGRGEVVPARYEVKAQKKDGTIFDVELSVGLITFQGEVARQGIIRDITQRKKMEQALRESEEKFRSFQSSVFDVIYRYDPQNNRYDFISPSVEQQTGYTIEEFLSRPKEITQSITHPEDWERVQSEVKQQIAKGPPGRPFHVEYRIIRKDKKESWVSDQKTLEFSPDGKLCRINGVVRDITERRRAEEALRKSEEKYRFLYEQSPSVNMIIGIYGVIKDVNKSLIKKLGYPKEEIIGKQALEFVVPEQREKVAAQLERDFKGEYTPEIDVDVYAKDRSIRTILFSPGQVILHEGNQSTCILVTGIDITERKQAEEALKESEERFRTIFETAQDSIFIKDRNLKYIQVNPAMEKLFGLPATELIGRTDEDLFGEEAEAHVREVDSRVLAGEVIEEEHAKPVKGILTTFHVIKVPMRDSEGRVVGLCGIARDIKERKRIEEKLKQYTRQMEEKNLELKAKNQALTATRAQLVQEEKLRALGQMASGVAHNFNNLLAIVLGRAQLLRRKVKELEIEKGLKSIEKAALDASFTVKRIQDFARVRKDQEFKWVNIDEEIEDVIALTKTKWKDQAEANGASITLELQKDRRKLPPVAGDAAGLREVFTNIIFNAVEAMPKGGKIVISTRTDRKSVFVSFTDSGTGIPEEVKQRIFDPFFTTKGVTNAGLGLSVAYGIIQRHRGDVQIESNQGEGTTVVVRLPLSNVLGKEEPKEEELEKPPVPGESAKILVIEDEKDVRELLFDILSSANYVVKLAPGGAEGLEICKMEKFDIVFTDLGMPRMSGWEVAKAIKEIDSSTAVFLITGWGVEMDEEKLKESGIDRIVTKPIQIENLLTLVSEVTESKKRAKGKWEDSCSA